MIGLKEHDVIKKEPLKLIEGVKPFARSLLQQRLDGKLRDPSDVLNIALSIQPSSGFTNVEWNNVCEFILLLRDAHRIPVARQLSKEHGLTLEY